jgi:SAM-dependent methyltransferase/3-polyprenyl-4-hydroxybenzoate decarboxylase
MTVLENTLRRAAVARIYDVGERCVLLAADGSGHALEGHSAALARAVLAFLAAPRAAAEVRAHVEALAGAPLPRPAVVDELLLLLVRAGAVEVGTPPPSPPRGPGPRVVLGLTGAIATAHAPLQVMRLQQRGFEVRVAATAEALRFVRTEALAALTHHPVAHAMWSEGQVHVVPHIELAQWADAVVVAPASATTIARMATGDHSSVVAAVALATRAPVLVVPSMNPAMYEGEAVQRNLARLAADGLHVAHPARGLEVADRPDERTPVFGASPPPEVVVQLLEAILRDRPPAVPRTAAAWDRLYRTTPAADLPWQRDEADADMLAAVARAAPRPCSLLEVGAGLGGLAAALGGMGHRVVATDLSAAALEHARARAPDAPVVWLQDDVTATRLRARFDAVVDRACLHVLSGDEPARYAATLARLVRPGGVLIIKTFAEGATERSATAYSADAMSRLFDDDFVLERDDASSLPGPRDAPAARLFVLRRRG